MATRTKNKPVPILHSQDYDDIFSMSGNQEKPKQPAGDGGQPTGSLQHDSPNTVATGKTDAPKRGRRPVPRRKKILFTFVTLILFLFTVELTARIGGFVIYDFNPYYLLYGFKAWQTEEGHSVKLDGYFKFPANKVFVFGTPEPCRINNHGFRGPDFWAEKPAGTFRVICLGGSSTFGYTNRDVGTYPHMLQQQFEQRLGSQRVEVINCGIPHMNTGHIVAMLKEELLGYEPDLVTIYSAYNDAGLPIDESTMQRAQRWFDEYSAAYAALRNISEKVGLSMHGRWTGYLSRVEREQIDRQRSLHLERTLSNYRSIIDLAKSRGIEVIVIKQPITTPTGIATRSTTKGYDWEFKAIAAKLEELGYAPGTDVPLYIHHELMARIEELARRENLKIIDNIALIDAHPEGLLTQVHLSEDANRRLAEVLHQAISPIVESVIGVGTSSPRTPDQATDGNGAK